MYWCNKRYNKKIIMRPGVLIAPDTFKEQKYHLSYYTHKYIPETLEHKSTLCDTKFKLITSTSEKRTQRKLFPLKGKCWAACPRKKSNQDFWGNGIEVRSEEKNIRKNILTTIRYTKMIRINSNG